MAIPDYQAFMLPMLRFLQDGRERTIREIADGLAEHFMLSEGEREERLPSGKQSVVNNRVGWAKTYLKFAGLVDNPTRGKVRITDLGRKVLSDNPRSIDLQFLKQFDSFCDFYSKSNSDEDESPVIPVTPPERRQTPDELIESAYQSLLQATAEEVLARLKSCSPAFFESVVVRLLMAMGYGGVAGHGSVTGKSGDGGIDGVIRQDKLGLDVVCIQAKRWEGPVGRPIVQQFVGSMDYYRAKKGVILTTSTFTRDGMEFLQRIEGKTVVLVDGDRLAALMIEHDLGVTTTKTYALKEVSNDFFDEGEG